MVQKLIIGLTGGFGTGKTTAGKFFKERNSCVIDADKIARKTLKPKSLVYKKIKKLFSGNINGSKGVLNKKRIAKEIFSDKSKRKKLEKIIHPFVREEIKERIRRTKKKIVVLEVPLLFEAGFDEMCNKTITVNSTDSAAAKRLQKKGFSLAEIKVRQEAQMPIKEKIKKADFILNNSKSIFQTKKQFNNIFKKLKNSIKET